MKGLEPSTFCMAIEAHWDSRALNRPQRGATGHIRPEANHPRFGLICGVSANQMPTSAQPGGTIVLCVGDCEFRVTLESIDEARVAAMIQNGTTPSLDELVAAGYEGDDPKQIAEAIREGRALLGRRLSQRGNHPGVGRAAWSPAKTPHEVPGRTTDLTPHEAPGRTTAKTPTRYPVAG